MKGLAKSVLIILLSTSTLVLAQEFSTTAAIQSSSQPFSVDLSSLSNVGGASISIRNNSSSTVSAGGVYPRQSAAFERGFDSGTPEQSACAGERPECRDSVLAVGVEQHVPLLLIGDDPEPSLRSARHSECRWIWMLQPKCKRSGLDLATAGLSGKSGFSCISHHS